MAYFICSNCGYGSASWMGKCPDCGQWNTFVNKPSFAQGDERKREETRKMDVTNLTKIKALLKNRLSTGIFEFDRVLGGGIIPGEVILLTGEPGVGKSTLLLQAVQNLKTLYISGEESPEQVRLRSDRLGIKLTNFLIADTLQVEGIKSGLESIKQKIDLVVIDSIQTVYSKDVNAAPGSVSQLKESAAKLIMLAKKNKVAVILVGHITKVGEIAGPKTLEHMVDCVLNFEGEKVSNFRILRAGKNRFGATDEIGIFEMADVGLTPVKNPLVFMEEAGEATAGRAVVGVAEGKRPLFFEIQTLATPTILAFPRRVVKGVDYNKVLLLLAVIRKHLSLSLDRFDIFVNVVGGVTITSPAADLGIVASIYSALKNIPVSKKTVYIGEVGLLGEVRRVFFEEKIIAEARRLQFKKILSSKSISSVRFIKKFF